MAAAQTRLAKKNAILRRRYAPVAPLTYYLELYGWDLDEARPYVLATEMPRIRTADGIDALLELAIFRSDIYMYPCSFFRRVGRATLHRIYAFVVDLDGVCVEDLQHLIGNTFFGMPPSFVVSSGGGLHLVYALDTPAECYRHRVPALEAILAGLQRHFGGRGLGYRVDHTTICQPFRVVGSQTKSGSVCTAYRSGARWTLDALSAAVGVAMPAPPARRLRQAETPVSASVVPFPTGRSGFYAHVRSRIAAETPAGHRELALFALAVIGYKCRLPRERVEADVRQIFSAFAARPGEARMRSCEQHKAMTGYTSRYIRTRAETLERWLGFTFPRTTTRNGRSRAEHGRWCREIRTEREGADRSSRIAAYIAEHPDASTREIARALGMCHKTITKYRTSPPVQTREGVGRSIAYNSPPVGDSGAFLPSLALPDVDDQRSVPAPPPPAIDRSIEIVCPSSQDLVCLDDRRIESAPPPGAGARAASVPSPPPSELPQPQEPVSPMSSDFVLIRLRACRLRAAAVADAQRRRPRARARAPG